jgi:tetratricopeptide (TPR) repeat protein
MKKLLISGALLCIVVTFYSCNGSGSKDAMLSHYKKVYKLSLTYGDFAAAENAIYHQWALDTANKLSYKDTLANLYFKSGQYLQAAVLGKEILAVKPHDAALMELVGESDQRINNLQEALSVYQTIYSSTHDLYHLYQIAVIQFGLNRLSECNQTIDQILSDPNSAKQNVQITISQTQAQNVPFSAAALNMRGVIAKSLKQNDAAKKAFTDALAAAPDFVLAKNNLAALK